MATEQNYPSPPAAQSGSAGPFFGQNGGDAAPQIPHDLQQLQNADLTRPPPAPPLTASNGGPSEYSHALAGSPDYARPPAASPDYDRRQNPGQDYGGPQSAAPAPEMDSRQPTSPQSLAQGVLSMGEQPQQGYPTSDPQRKRSKVSRACDECRRKKIRCDAPENSTEPCSSCKRTRVRCQFSRQPMKRGPSKGYIKELADRVVTLENQLAPQGVHGSEFQYPPGFEDGIPQRMGEPPEYSPSPGGSQLPRKRTHSMSESGSMYRDAPYQPARQSYGGPYSTDASGRYPSYPPTANMVRTPQSASTEPNHYPPRNPYSPTSWRYGSGPFGNRRDSVATPQETDVREVDPSELPDWDESIVDEYYKIIHQTFPLLPHSKARLRLRLANCPKTLRDAFFVALDCSIRSFPISQMPFTDASKQNTKRAAELISNSQYENASSTSISANLVYIQTLVLMALESDNHGPATMRGQVGPPRAEWLGRAIGVATHLKLNVFHPRAGFAETDQDGDERLGRRTWWILFILDRWHASSTSSLLQMPENSSSLHPEDQLILSEQTYHLARLSYILGHLTTILQQPPALMSPTSAAAPIISTTILGEIERFRESVESLLLSAPNLIHLSYWHVRLLVLRLTSSTRPHELLPPATRMASILNSRHTMLTPLNHHFAALAALTLAELSEFPETRKQAERGLEDLIEAINTRKGLMSREDSLGWDSAIRELVQGRKRQLSGSSALADEPGSAREREGESSKQPAGLQHLADAAIGGRKEGQGQGQQSQDAPSTTQHLPANAKDNASAASSTSPTNTVRPHAEAGYDPTLLTRHGYLAALAQEAHGGR